MHAQLGSVRGSHRILVNPAGLADELRRCDLAVIGEGAVKYEAAATATPAIILARPGQTPPHEVYFAEVGSARFLGRADGLSAAEIGTAVGRLLDDPAERTRVSRAGAALLDGRAGARIAEALREAGRAAT